MSIDGPRQNASGKSALPLVRLPLILPFINTLDRMEADTDAVLDRQGLARESVQDPNLFISVNIIRRFLEDAAVAADDPFLGVHVGEQLDFSASAGKRCSVDSRRVAPASHRSL